MHVSCGAAGCLKCYENPMAPDLGSCLLDLAATARREFVMCAPFAKRVVIDRLLTEVPSGVELSLITRWRPEEVAAGVSDTAVLASMRSRGGVVYLHDRLHAKFYRNETKVMLGSANLTATALGWSPAPNLELLVEGSSDQTEWLERYLLTESVEATQAMADEVDELARILPRIDFANVATPEPVNSTARDWIPQLRAPSDLFLAYRWGPGRLASRSAEAAATDLTVLDLPAGLDQTQFRQLVGHRLLNQPAFKAVDKFIETPRRFGEVSRMLSDLVGCSRAEGDEAWQTMMRWMLEFMPDRYERDVARHTEVLRRV